MTFLMASMLVLVTFSIMIIPTVSAESGPIDFYLQSSSIAVDVGDDFNIAVNINTTENVNVSWYNISLLT